MLECHRRLLCVNGVQRALIPNLRLGNEADARADVRHAPARRHVCCHAQPSPAQPSTTTRLRGLPSTRWRARARPAPALRSFARPNSSRATAHAPPCAPKAPGEGMAERRGQSPRAPRARRCLGTVVPRRLRSWCRAARRARGHRRRSRREAREATALGRACHCALSALPPQGRWPSPRFPAPSHLTARSRRSSPPSAAAFLPRGSRLNHWLNPFFKTKNM